MRLWSKLIAKCDDIYCIKEMLRMRDVEAKEAYLHERKLTARKINRQKEKRRNSSISFKTEQKQNPSRRLSKERAHSVGGIPRTQSAPCNPFAEEAESRR